MAQREWRRAPECRFRRIPAMRALVPLAWLEQLATLVGRMHGYVIPDFHEDIGTPERLVHATAGWAARESTRLSATSGMEAGH